MYGESALLGDQALAALVAPLYAFAATFILLRLMAFGFRLRVTEREEAIGLDVMQHGEEAYVTRRGRDPRRAGRRARPRPVRDEPGLGEQRPAGYASPSASNSRRKPSNSRRCPSSSRRIAMTMSCVTQSIPSVTSMIRL